MDDQLYDEFGNYLGPDLESEDESSEDERGEAELAWDANVQHENVTTAEPLALDGFTGVQARGLL